MNILNIKDKVLSKKALTKEEALFVYSYHDLDLLCVLANEIREFFLQDKFDLCSIVNAKSGRCSEDCKFCAQSAHFPCEINKYSFLEDESILKKAIEDANNGIKRFSLVTSGKRLSKKDLEKAILIIRKIKKYTNLHVCVSFGLLDKEDFKLLKEAGVSRIHNNLESSENFYKEVCTTHSFADKLQTIENAQNAGLEVCSGGIFGLGESVEDRIDMAFTLKSLGIKSVPLNILNPIKHTPYENNTVLSYEEILRIVTTYRFILPDVFLRAAGCRGLLFDKGEKLLKSGLNAFISGNMLTTYGISCKSDLQMLDSIGFKVVN